MSSALTVIYDDRVEPPADIAGIIGAARFSEIIHRRVTLGEIIRQDLRRGGADDLFHLVDAGDTKHLADLIENSSVDRVFLWLPSYFLPRAPGALSHLVRKSRFALRSTLLMQPIKDRAPAVLMRGEALGLLRAREEFIENEIFANIAHSSPIVFDHCRFIDLRDLDKFFDFFSGATETRHFNQMQTSGRVYIKSSSNRLKMEAEYRFFHIAPEAMKPFLVPSFDFHDDGEKASYAMERLSIPDAALQIIHKAFDENSFKNLVDRFGSFLKVRQARFVGQEECRRVAQEAILSKMQDRLTAFLETDVGQRVDGLLARAGPIGSLQAMADRAGAILRRAIQKDTSEALVIGHGDPCFSNILFDRRSSVFRLIDPKGAITLDGAWMHPLYDVAKFSHSVLGGYDFVNNNLADCFLDEQLLLDLRLDDGGVPEAFRTIFLEFLKSIGIPLDVVRAYEMSLFMSMLPLHADHPRKLACFALIAAKLIVMLEGANVL